MERRVGAIPLSCAARTHAYIVDGRILRIRCRDNRCPECQAAKERGERAYHCWDVSSLRGWTEFEPIHRQHDKELNHGE